MTTEANIMGLEMTTSPQTTPQEPGAAASMQQRSALGLVGRILGWVAMVAAGLVVLGLLAITVGPRFLPYQALIVRSGSMSPTIPTGSIVFYTKIPSAKVKVGDVIVFQKPGSTNEKVTHRVYKIGQDSTGRYFITKGDANGSPDDWRVPAVGTGWIARFHLPSIGYALVYLQSTLARLLLLVIPAILLGAITLYEIWQDRARGASA
ncbi:MAG TPA: signal peptidase I [Gaiellaceae bacterium]|nr:signal peptidase I [Gaiellaceae bacterium]